EYAILITDAWQKRELGRKLTEYCMQVAKKWELKRMVAQTTSDNRPMLAVFQKLGFKINYSNQESTVNVEKDIDENFLK
ncbi:MAG: GNAT family N-acetyltransferase, partial [candidate division Zixibacteria bacterium]|nr:GNAT family N-acetyltransferase [candidate division Zixibacteria bacterium]